MTLLSAINEVCDVVKLDRFLSIYGTDDPNAQTMVTLANEAGREIARRGDWQRMLKTTGVTATPSTLPADFSRMNPGGPLYSLTFGFVRPVLNAAQWKLLGASPSTTPFYRINEGELEILPAGAASDAELGYVSKNWALSNVGAEADTFQADDDTTLFPEDLLILNVLWRWKRQKGVGYSDELSEFEATFEQRLAADRGAS